MGQAKDKLNPPAKSFFAAIIDRLAAVKFAVAVVVIIAAACVVGTILPQGADAAKYLAKNPAAADRVKLWGTLGLTNVYTSWWFIGLLCVLAASVATCSTRRFSTALRTTGYARWRSVGSMLTHISFLLILAGGVIRGTWGHKGYLQFREGEMVAEFIGERGPQPLPFAVHLEKFEIERYEEKTADQLFVQWLENGRQAMLPVTVGVEQVFEGFKITVLQYVPDFTVDSQTRQITTRSSQPNNPAILVAVNGPTYQNHKWVFAKFPDFQHENAQASPLRLVYAARPASGPIKSFKSTLNLMEGDKVALHKTIEVNSPVRFKGYTLYQSGYNPNDLAYTSLQVVKDPGVGVVYAGFGLMIAGLAVVFYVNPWLNARRKTA